MAKQGHEVTVFTLKDSTLKIKEVINGVKVYRSITLPNAAEFIGICLREDIRNWGAGMKFFVDVFLYNILSAVKVIRLIKEKGYKFDIISAHDWLSAIAGVLVKKETGVPLVFHIHSTEWGRVGDGSPTIKEIEKTAAQIADAIITVSYPMQEDLIRHGFPAEKIKVCWNGVDPEKYDPTKVSKEDVERLRENYGIGPEERMLFFIGRLTGVKGIINLIKAMPMILNKHLEAKLVIIGKGELEQTIFDLVRTLGIEERIKTRFEFVSEQERILHYAASDLCIFPSQYEPFGIVALEAMSMEKPVVVGANGVSGFRDVVIPSGPEQTGIHVDGNNPADIAWGVNALLEDMERAKEMGKRGRIRVKQYFTWEKAAERTLSIYQEVIKGT
jgi:glycosyltransferase involved in cell wall biosynthesis